MHSVVKLVLCLVAVILKPQVSAFSVPNAFSKSHTLMSNGFSREPSSLALWMSDNKKEDNQVTEARAMKREPVEEKKNDNPFATLFGGSTSTKKVKQIDPRSLKTDLTEEVSPTPTSIPKKYNAGLVGDGSEMWIDEPKKKAAPVKRKAPVATKKAPAPAALATVAEDDSAKKVKMEAKKQAAVAAEKKTADEIKLKAIAKSKVDAEAKIAAEKADADAKAKRDANTYAKTAAVAAPVAVKKVTPKPMAKVDAKREKVVTNPATSTSGDSIDPIKSLIENLEKGKVDASTATETLKKKEAELEADRVKKLNNKGYNMVIGGTNIGLVLGYLIALNSIVNGLTDFQTAAIINIAPAIVLGATFYYLHFIAMKPSNKLSQDANVKQAYEFINNTVGKNTLLLKNSIKSIIVGKVESFQNEVKSKVKATREDIQNIPNTIQAGLESTLDEAKKSTQTAINTKIEAIQQFPSKLVENSKNAVKTAIVDSKEALSRSVDETIEGVKNLPTTVVDGVSKAATSTADAVVSEIQAAPKKITENIRKEVEAIPTKITSAVGDAKGSIQRDLSTKTKQITSSIPGIENKSVTPTNKDSPLNSKAKN